MSYIPLRRGFTGPSDKIGGSSPYHWDFKASQSLPIGEQVKAFDTLVRQYQSHGREVEFSNASVAGMHWNPAANFDDKVKLYNQAINAHSHSMHPGWNSIDAYVPFKGKSRFDQGAVEGASIYVPGIPGGKVRSSSGGGYGYFSEVLNPKGEVVFKVGHGDTSRPEKEAELVVPELQEQPQLGQDSNGKEDPNSLANSMLQMYLLGLGVNKEKEVKPVDRIKQQVMLSVFAPQKSSTLMRYLSEPSPYEELTA